MLSGFSYNKKVAGGQPTHQQRHNGAVCTGDLVYLTWNNALPTSPEVAKNNTQHWNGNEAHRLQTAHSGEAFPSGNSSEVDCQWAAPARQANACRQREAVFTSHDWTGRGFTRGSFYVLFLYLSHDQTLGKLCLMLVLTVGAWLLKTGLTCCDSTSAAVSFTVHRLLQQTRKRWVPAAFALEKKPEWGAGADQSNLVLQ